MANTIADKLTYLNGTKDAIKQAIIAKGVEVTDTDTFRSYANKIEAIQSGGGGTVNLPDGTKFSNSIFKTINDSIIPYLETQTNMYNMFSSCINLTSVPIFDTSRVTTMSYMFYNCQSLTSVPIFETSRVTDTEYMLSNCISLTTVPQLDTSNVYDMSGMFAYSSNLTSIPLLNVSKTRILSNMFWACSSLTNLGGFTGLKLSLDLSSSPLLTVDSVMNVINAAADMTSSPETLTLHKDVFNKLSQEQIATASAKGWNVASA